MTDSIRFALSGGAERLYAALLVKEAAKRETIARAKARAATGSPPPGPVSWSDTGARRRRIARAAAITNSSAIVPKPADRAPRVVSAAEVLPPSKNSPFPRRPDLRTFEPNRLDLKTFEPAAHKSGGGGVGGGGRGGGRGGLSPATKKGLLAASIMAGLVTAGYAGHRAWKGRDKR